MNSIQGKVLSGLLNGAKKATDAVSDKAFERVETSLLGKSSQPKTKDSQLINKLGAVLDNIGLSEEEKEAKRAQEAEELAMKNVKPASSKSPEQTPLEDSINDALGRIALLGEGLEEDQKHQLISDISLLVKNGRRYNSKQSEWVMRMYGNHA